LSKDAVDIVTTKIVDRMILKVELRNETLDLRIHFENGLILEVLPNSWGYEAWNLQKRLGQEWIALGGVNLVEFKR
jgi:hypothetical protein